MGIDFLRGCRVIDLTDKGNLCIRLLVDMGAGIIRIEKPGQPAASDLGNKGEQHLNIYLENKEGATVFKQMVQNADVLVENYPAGYLASLGLDYPALKEINVRLVMASITPFGQNGPYKDLKSTDLISSALGGTMYICGEPGQPPLKPFGQQTNHTAGLFAANAIMLALFQRHSSNQGQYIDISIHECVAATLDHVMVRYFYEGVVAERTGRTYWNRAFRLFPCQDGYILLSISHQWEILVEWLDSEGMAADLKDKKWLDDVERQTNFQHIVDVLEKWTRSHHVDELVEQGQLMRFPWAKAASIPQVVNNPHLAQRGFFREATDPTSGKTYKYPSLPFKSISL